MDWAVATTWPNCEARARVELERLNFTCYLPTFLINLKTHNRKCALFPGYFFFQIDAGWLRLFNYSLNYVNSILMSGEKPTKVDNDLICRIRAREGTDGHIIIPKPAYQQHFHRNQPVRVKRGQMIGLHGLFECYTGPERVRVLLEMMGRATCVTMKSDELSGEIYDHRFRSRAHRKRLLNKRRRQSSTVALNA